MMGYWEFTFVVVGLWITIIGTMIIAWKWLTGGYNSNMEKGERHEKL